MKKLVSFVLVLALVLGSFSMAFAVPADVEGTDYEAAVTALTGLGVVTGYPDGTYKPAQAVTRAEAAKLVVTALGLAEYAAGNTASFTDLEGYGWAKGYIGYAEALGILKGDGNGKFRPADPVSYQEMATILVRACGYTDASLPGTWPANYVVKAKALGIMDDIAQAGDADANRGDVAIMIYNNLENRIGTINLDNQWVANTPADTMMARLDQDLYDPDDTATAAAVGDAFILDDNDTVADGVNVKAYYGAYVVAYANAKNEITGIKEVKSTFLTGEFTTTSGVKFIADEVTYSVADNNANSTFDDGKVVITTSGAINTGNAPSGEVTIAVDLSGKKIKEVYSITTWDGDNYVWTEAYAKQLDKNSKVAGNSFVMDDNDEIDTTSFALVGVDSLDKIAEGDVVTVYVNGTITKIEVSNKTVVGTVTKRASDTGYVINGVTYYLDAAANATDTSFDLSSEGTFFLNYAGDIVDFEGVTETKNYAVVNDTLKAYKEAGYSTTSTYAIELFTAAGELKVFEVDKDVVVTGAAAATIVSTGAVTDSATKIAADAIVIYTLDKDGVIDGIEVPDQTKITSGQYTAKGFLDKKEVANNVVVFTGKANPTDSTLAVAATKDIPVGETLNDTIYVADTDNVIVAIITNETTTSDTYGVITAYSEVKDADDVRVYEVEMLIDGAPVTYLTDSQENSGIINQNVLFKVNLKDGVIDSLATTTTAINTTVTAVKAGSINVGSGYEEVADDVVVYEYVEKADGTFDKWVVSDLTSIMEDDYVSLFDTNTNEGHEGYDIIVFKAAE